MARIRTIKPEFPQSESMGRVSREARLCFVLLWTLADDEGRLRGNSRMLASLLFPYDDDAPALIDGWLSELEREECVERYLVDGTAYLAVCKWLSHQKIDRPSASKIPGPTEGSRILANGREPSSLDQGSRIKDQGSKEGDQDQRDKAAPRVRSLSVADLIERGVTDQVATEFLAIRKRKKAPLSALALEGIENEAKAAGWALDAALRECVARGWQGFKAEWVAKRSKAAEPVRTPKSFREADEEAARRRFEEAAGRAPARGEVIDAEPSQVLLLGGES